MTATLPTTGRLTTRAQAGFGLAGIGALLLAFSMLTLMFAIPVASAHGGFPHGDQNCDVFGAESADGGFKVNINSAVVPPTGAPDAANITGVTWSITDDPAYPVVDTAVSSTGYWFNYSITTVAYALYGIYVKNGASNPGDQVALNTSINPGSIEIPSGNSHIVLCFDATGIEDTTTTSQATTTTTTTLGTTTTTTLGTTTTTTLGTTTTTIGGPTTTTTTIADTTTTTAGTTTTTIGGPTTTTTIPPATTTTGGTTTTTLGGPCDPNDPECLPNTGAGSLVFVLLSGLGLLFLGVGILMVADERRRVVAV